MVAPTNTYDSDILLDLGHVPDVDVENPDSLYRELLDIHNAIEALTIEFTIFVRRERAVTVVDPSMSPYTVLITDKLILTDTSLGNVTVFLPPSASAIGYDYEVKQKLGSNETLVLGDSVLSEEIDSDAGGIIIEFQDAISLKNDGFNWWINN